MYVHESMKSYCFLVRHCVVSVVQRAIVQKYSVHVLVHVLTC